MALSNGFDSNKCGAILRAIEEEERKYKELKKELSSCENQLRANEILGNRDFPLEKLFRVQVHVFRTLSNLVAVWPEKLAQDELSSQCLRSPAEDSNIFLIEVLVARQFHDMILTREGNWLAHVSVTAGDRKSAKSVTLQRRAANAITATLAFPRRRANDETVKVCLASTVNWRRVELAAIRTDISYKFASVGAASSCTSTAASVAKINRIYERDVECRTKSPSASSEALAFSYKLRCELDGESFIAALTRHAYASLDPAQIVCNEGNCTAKIEINDQRAQLELDVGKKALRIQAPGEELCQLKRYFTTVLASLNDPLGRKVLRRDFQHIQSVNVLKDARTTLTKALAYDRVDVHDLLDVYDVYQRFVDGAPL